MAGQRKALVCGASKGIGRAIAEELLSQGFAVHAVARSETELKSLHTTYSVADFSNPDSVQELLRELPEDFHILVCNSGGPASGPLVDAKITDFDAAFRSHLYVNHMLMQKLVPFMKREKFGRILTVLSTSVKAPIPNLGVSNTLRAAMAAWAKTLAAELGPFGITVNNILPGATETDRLRSLLKNSSERDWLAAIPAGRFADPKETAKAAAFLLSESASYINGINLPVDGGRLNSL